MNLLLLTALSAVVTLVPIHVLADHPLDVRIEPIGIDEAGARILTELVLQQPEIERRLTGKRWRVLSADFGDAALPKAEPADRQNTFTLQVYDYDGDELLTVRGNAITGAAERIETGLEQPNPSPEEFDDARAILLEDPRFGPKLRDGKIETYEAMPPVIDLRTSEGERAERIIAVGVSPKRGSAHEVIGINLSRRTVMRFPGGAPPTSLATRNHCGFPNANQSNNARGIPGQAQITVSRGAETLWTFTVVRPSASSGAYGSAIDLRKILYRGQLAISQAHVPILNVRYDGDACGPYRDWQYTENPFSATGTDLASGIRRASTPAKTIFESASDTGNFRGVAIYTEGTATVLVSELAAGWYRYVSEFRFHEDGTIEPRFKFSAVANSCVCKRHHHNVYWRFDFDVAEAERNVAEVSDGVRWRAVSTEARHRKSASVKSWRVLNPTTGAGYQIIPGANDGVADTYAKGDAWLLKFRQGQIDDSSVRVSTAANLDAFVTGESLANTDVVFWYSAHFTHDTSNETVPHIVGPILRPVNWSGR